MQMKATLVIVLIALFAVQQSECFWGTVAKIGSKVLGALGDDIRNIREMVCYFFFRKTSLWLGLSYF